MKNIHEQNDNITEIDKDWWNERNLFQAFLMEKLGVKHGDPESSKYWSIEIAKFVSDLIDGKNGKDNSVIKPLIENNDYEKASQLVLEALKSESKELLYH